MKLFFTILNFSRDEKSLDELKRDLVNFDSERQVIEKENAFNSENRVVSSVIKEDMGQNSAEKT